MERNILMPISQVIGILGSLIGTTATLLGAWVYIQTKRPPKMELLTAGIVIGVILVTIVGLAVLISRETNISINGQKTIPVPTVPVPVPGLPGPSQPGPSPHRHLLLHQHRRLLRRLLLRQLRHLPFPRRRRHNRFHPQERQLLKQTSTTVTLKQRNF